MSSTGQAVGAVVGGVIGFMVGGPAGAVYGAQLGMMAGGAIDPPKGPNIRGPRLNDLTQQASSYGQPIPRVYGTIATMGNVFWLEGNALKETANKKKSGGKGGGGGATTTTYTYSATFAVGLCRGEMAGVRRIWIGGQLWYDAGADDLESIIASNEKAQYFRFYPGSDTQSPDPRMQADVGVGNCPAFVGLCYVVFYDLPLEQYGNSIAAAQVKVEVVSTASFSDFSRIFRGDATSAFAGWSMPKNWVTPIDKQPDSVIMRQVAIDAIPVSEYLSVDHSVYGQIATRVPALGPSYYYVAPFYEGRHRVCAADSGCAHICEGGGEYGWTVYDTGFSGVGNPVPSVYSNGDVFCAAVVKPGFSDAQIVMFKGGAKVVFDSFYALGIPRFVVDDAGGVIYLMWRPLSGNAIVRAYDMSDLSLVDEYVAADPINTTYMMYIAGGVLCTVVNDGGYYFLRRYSLVGGAQLDDVFVQPIVGSGDIFGWGDKNFIYMGSSFGGQYLDIFQINAISANAVSLADIVKTELLQSSILTDADIDVADLTATVRGYRVTNVGAIRAAIEPLRAAWPFDLIQDGAKVKAVRRGKPSVMTIDAADLDARAIGAARGVQIAENREMDTQLPRRVDLQYLAVEREYDAGEQSDERLNTDAINVQQVEMPIAMTDAEAAGMVQVLLYLYWLERYDIAITLPPSCIALQPADVITITAPWASYELRLTQVAYQPDGRLECTAKYNSAAIYTPAALGASGHVTGKGIALAGPSLYHLLDIPTLIDALDRPGFVAAMAGYTNGWPGGVLVRSTDGGATWANLQAFAGPVPMGYASNAIGSGRFDIIDAASALNVNLIAGDIYSVTELAMYGGANWFAYGAPGRWEIIAARDAVVETDNSITLSNLLRGRMGTEWAAGQHVAGDVIVQLDDADVAWIERTTSDIGTERLYRGITSGKALASDSDRAFTYAGVNLRPLSPVRLNGSRHPSTNDWTLTWTRRGRVDAQWRDYVDVPVGEVSEAYEVEIYTSAAYTTLKRTITGLIVATASYSSADQVTDFGANQSTLYVRVYQISATVGRGYPLEATITR